jgi:ribose transport system permease protein
VRRIFTVINNGLNLLNVSIYWQLIAIGVIIVIAVELDVVRRRLEERFRTMQAGR